MTKLKEVNYLPFVIYGALLITLIITPWVNVDSMIIPKQIILFLLASFLIPPLIKSINKDQFRLFQQVFLLVALVSFQFIIVLILSNSPWEQQIFGRTGRGLGLITYLSLLILYLYVLLNSQKKHLDMILSSLVVSCAVSSVYSTIQFFGKDIFAWTTKTNGIIGTLGNPNFQSSLAAMALIPTLVFFWKRKFGYLFSIVTTSFLLFIIFITRSTQGYITALVAIFVFLIIFLWSRKMHIPVIVLSLFWLSSSIIALLGMLNKGILSYYLYKPSVRSRGDFWRSAFESANDSPIFGHGIDSFADNYLLYRDERAATGIGEFTDNAHNFYLEFATNGGYPLAIYMLLLSLITLSSFIRYLRALDYFDYKMSALFTAWVVFQLQSFISPANISMLVWNTIISSFLVSIHKTSISAEKNSQKTPKLKSTTNLTSSLLMTTLACLVIYPLFNTDRLQLKSSQTRDALLAVEVSKMYPESTLRYSRLGSAMLESNLPVQALEIGRAAIDFNPNAVSGWALILANQSAPIDERKKAAKKIIDLDPYNKIVKDFNF